MAEVQTNEPWPDDSEKLAKEIADQLKVTEEKQAKKRSTIHKITCVACGKIASEVSRNYDEPGWVTIELLCGHVIIEESIKEVKSEISIYDRLQTVITKKRPYIHQVEYIAFAEKSHAPHGAICTDEMGLGKSLAGLWLMKEHPEWWPFIIVTKGSIMENWFRETLDALGIIPQTLESSSDIPLVEGTCKVPFDCFIVSVDLLSRKGCKWVKDKKYHEKIKAVIIDECQTIKNMDAKRTAAVRLLCEGKKVFPFSGTPIDKNAAEWFNVFNLVWPERFHSYQAFVNEWVETYRTGYGTVRLGGIKRHKMSEWKLLTEKFIIRRKRADVAKDLPPIKRDQRFINLSEEVAKAYNKVYDDWEAEYDREDRGPRERNTNLLGYMSRMRHIVGLAKVKPVLDAIEDFLDSTDRKLLVFTHHQDVAELVHKHLAMKIQERSAESGEYEAPPLLLAAEVPKDKRQALVDKFAGSWTPKGTDEAVVENAIAVKDGSPRVMIAATQVGGIGLNIQFVSDIFMAERQWTSGAEEQAEGRTSRFGARHAWVNSLYFIATGTFDELITELGERSRAAMSSALDGKYVQWDDNDFMRKLMEELRKLGRVRRWSPR